MIFSEPGKTAYDIEFHVGPIPVRIHPFFWVLGLLLGASGDLPGLLSWVVAVFISILVHELGHVYAFVRYGVPAKVVLHAFGGLAIPMNQHAARRLGRGQSIFISFAGPLAGFILAGLIFIAIKIIGGTVLMGPFFEVKSPMPDWWDKFLYMMLWINIGWGFLNLLPVYPLDGGQISMEVNRELDPVNGWMKAHWIAIVVAALIAVYGLTSGSFFMAFLFGYLAYDNWVRVQGPRWR